MPKQQRNGCRLSFDFNFYFTRMCVACMTVSSVMVSAMVVSPVIGVVHNRLMTFDFHLAFYLLCRCNYAKTYQCDQTKNKLFHIYVFPVTVINTVPFV